MCGIVGIYGKEAVARDLYYGLFSLQHRGQESCGLAVMNGPNLSYHRGMGLVSEIFEEENIRSLKGNIGIGHVRYSTAGGSFEYNTQPLMGFCKGGRVSIAHNGNLVNSKILRERLEDEGMMFQTTIDSEVILYLITRYYRGDIVESVKTTMDYIKGAYSLVVVLENKLVALRDPNGFRPLIMGKRGEEYIFASESSVIDIMGGEVIRDLEPGEIIVVENSKVKSYFYEKKCKKTSCIFEHIYFARNDAVIDQIKVYDFRVKTGEILARENPLEADIVIPVPDSGWAGALGYSKESGLPLMEGLVKNRYVGRSFIKPTQKERETAVKLKLNPQRSVVEGKSIVLVDDSIVRGTTSKKLIESLKKAGAKEVHMRITSPPVKYSCYFGIDTPRRSQLIASSKSIEEIGRAIGADSIGFLSIEGMNEAVEGREEFCKACFDGKYPVDPVILI